jgi:predicted DNA binding protein
VACRLLLTLPSNVWLGPLTRAHPAVRVEVLDRLEISPGRILFDVQLPPSPKIDWGRELRTQRDVESVELIDANPQTEIYRVLFVGRTFVPLVKKLRVLRRFPFPVQNGVATWLVVGPNARVRNLLRALRQSRVSFKIDSIRRSFRSDVSALLTVRQREVLHRAVSEGYFEVPRRITLSALAARMGVASSTLSVTLAVIEKKIVEPLAGPGRALPILPRSPS